MSGIFVPSSGGAGGTVAQGAAAALAGAWPVEITDGTNGPVTVTSGKALTTDVIDRAARLLGIIYGTLGQIVQRIASGTPLASSIAVTDNAVVVAQSMQAALSADILYADINVSSSGDNTIVAAVANKIIRVLGYKLVCTGANTVEWRDGAAGTVIDGPMAIAANGGVVEPNSPIPVMKTSSGNALVLNLTAASQVGGRVTYLQG